MVKTQEPVAPPSNEWSVDSIVLKFLCCVLLFFFISLKFIRDTQDALSLTHANGKLLIDAH